MTAPALSSPSSRRAPGWWYPWLFVGAMALVVVVNGVMISFALGTWTGFETRSHYLKGLDYNRALEGQAAQDRLGWRAAIAWSPDANGIHAGTLAVSLRDRDGNPVDGIAGEVLFLRPVGDGLDRKAPLVAAGAGRYAARLALPAAGQWNVRVHAWRGSDAVQIVERLRVP